MTSISNEFLQLGGDESNGLSTVKNKASGKATLSKGAQGGDNEFVLSGGQSACKVERGGSGGLAVSLGRRCMFLESEEEVRQKRKEKRNRSEESKARWEGELRAFVGLMMHGTSQSRQSNQRAISQAPVILASLISRHSPTRTLFSFPFSSIRSNVLPIQVTACLMAFR